MSYDLLGKEMTEDETPYLILFGTGWGLTNEIMDMSYKNSGTDKGERQNIIIYL